MPETNLTCCCLNHTHDQLIDGAFEQETTMIPIGNSVNYTSKLWQNPEITYAWIGRNGSIEEIVNAWIDWINTNTGIRLKEIDDYTKSDMRFNVDPSQGGRSYFGNDALKIADKTQWTTNFGFEEFHPILKQTTPEIDWWKICRIANHELGHAVFSQIHEQFHPDVHYSDYDRTYRIAQGISVEEIDRHYAFKELIRLGTPDVFTSKVGDPKSVSLYPTGVLRLKPESQHFGFLDSDQVKINYGLSVGDENYWKATYSSAPVEPVKPIDNCVNPFKVAQVRKLLLQADNILKSN